MRAIVIEKFGPPKNLELKDVEKPEIDSPNKVLVKIYFAGVNPVDTYVREGFFSNLPHLPFTPGKDAAGVIEAIGDSVSDFIVGQRVFICGLELGKFGTYAEYTVVDQKDVFPLDDRLEFDQGAALGIPYFTAYRALVIRGKCKSGESVLIHGASGAVGLATVQLAKKLGLKVLGTAGSEEGRTLVKENGADIVFNHKAKDNRDIIYKATNNDGVDIIIEMLANVNLDKDLNYLARRGRIVVVGSRGAVKFDCRKMMLPETEIVGLALMSSTEKEWKETSTAIVKGITEGWVKPVIYKRYALAHARLAHEDIMSPSQNKKGKLVINMVQGSQDTD